VSGHGVADVVILGAGPAGVGAAYRAARAGHRVVLLERGERVGGAAGSREVAGISVDFGSHRLHPSIDPVILADLRALLGDDLQRRRRNGRIRLAGRWIAFPLRAGDLVRRLPPRFVAGAVVDALGSPLRHPRADTFAEVLRAGLGTTMCEAFYFPYARKLWGVEPGQLSGEQARRRVSADSPAKLLRRVLGAGGREKAFFYYPRRGFGTISERLADAARAAGADVWLGDGAERVEVRPDRVAVTLTSGETVTARRGWSTVPLPALARMIDPAPPPEVLASVTRLRSRAILLVYVVLDMQRYTPFDAHYFPGAETPVTRVSEPRNYRDGDDPPGRTVLCAEIPCDRGDVRWRASDAELGEVVVHALSVSALPVARPSAVRVHRLPHAYPVYETGFDRAFAALDDWIAAQPRLLSFGRQGLFAHDNTHHALAMAWAAADALRPGGDFDTATWAAARSRFARHVVED
jgi:protoporphyrinogen oxidase